MLFMAIVLSDPLSRETGTRPYFRAHDNNPTLTNPLISGFPYLGRSVVTMIVSNNLSSTNRWFDPRFELQRAREH